MSRWQRIAFGLAVVAAACSPTGVRSTDSQVVRSSPPHELRGPYVEAGTSFTVTLEQALGTDFSLPGQPFTGRIDNDLGAADGTLVVPAGAIVQGRVTRARGGEAPLLELAFDSVRTHDGRELLLEARIERAEQVRMREPGSLEGERRQSMMAGVPNAAAKLPESFRRGPLSARAAPAPTSPTEQPYDPAPTAPTGTARVQHIRLPEGSTLRVQLTRPLVR